MTKRQEHTQVGYPISAAMAAAMVFIGRALANAGIKWIAIAVLIIDGRNPSDVTYVLYPAGALPVKYMK